jgi:hypothetical protein
MTRLTPEVSRTDIGKGRENRVDEAPSGIGIVKETRASIHGNGRDARVVSWLGSSV